MSTHTTILIRLVIWLVALTIPVQNLPAASCGCSECAINLRAKPECQTCCCALTEQAARTCCCSQRQERCCSQNPQKSDSECQCGGNCRCGQSEPTQPFTPISPPNLIESVAQTADSANGNLLPLAPQTPEGHSKASSTSYASTALDRCAALCRFTL